MLILQPSICHVISPTGLPGFEGRFIGPGGYSSLARCMGRAFEIPDFRVFLGCICNR